MTISVLIATKNRPSDLTTCIERLLKSSLPNFEIIVIDQSNSTLSKTVIDTFSNPRIRYIKSTARGKSAALNKGISLAHGELIAFTDDDCIVTPSWLASIHSSFKKNPQVDGLFGSTYPYTPTRKKGTVCPSTFTRKKAHIITKPQYHVSEIGFGNNMAIKKKTLLKSGGFREWIGPNTQAPASEDAEIELRILTRGGVLAYDPKIRLFHNRWLSPRELRIQESKYTRGEAACYSYYYFSSYHFAKTVLRRGFKMHTRTALAALSSITKYGMNKHTIGTLYWAIRIYFSYVAGIAIGLSYSLLDPPGRRAV